MCCEFCFLCCCYSDCGLMGAAESNLITACIQAQVPRLLPAVFSASLCAFPRSCFPVFPVLSAPCRSLWFSELVYVVDLALLVALSYKESNLVFFVCFLLNSFLACLVVFSLFPWSLLDSKRLFLQLLDLCLGLWSRLCSPQNS